MKRSLVPALVASTCLLLALAACSDGGSSDTRPATAGPGASPPEIGGADPSAPDEPDASEADLVAPLADGIEFVGAVRRSTQGSREVRTAFDAEFVALDEPMTEAAVRRAVVEDAMGCHVHRGAYEGLHPLNELPESLGHRPVSAGEVLPVMNPTGTLTEMRTVPQDAAGATVGKYRPAEPYLNIAREDLSDYGLNGPLAVHVPGSAFPQAQGLIVPLADIFSSRGIGAKDRSGSYYPLYYTTFPSAIPKEVAVNWTPGSDPDALAVITLYSFSDKDGDGARDDSSLRCIVPSADGQFVTPEALLDDLDDYYEAMTFSNTRTTVERRGNILIFLSDEHFGQDSYGPIAPRLDDVPD